MSTFADRVREAVGYAKTRGTNITAIAKACGVSRQTIYQWMQEGERVEVKGSVLVEFAYITGYDARWIANNKGLKLGEATNPVIKEIEKCLNIMDQSDINIVLGLCKQLGGARKTILEAQKEAMDKSK